MKFCSYWPSRIVKTPPMMGRTPKNQTCVLFFGTKNFGFVDVNKVENYLEHREKFIKKGRGAPFKDAVYQMDQFIENPNKFRSHAFVKNPTNNKISIKTEHMIEKLIGVKREPTFANEMIPNNYLTQNKKQPENLSSTSQTEADEKKNLISELNNVRSEYQSTCFNLNKKIDSMHAINVEKNKEIEHMKVKIALLSKENKQLEARVKQLQSKVVNCENISVQSSKTLKEDVEEDETVYEVEKLLGDKLINNVRHYLVRWKEYSSQHDTWEPISNIFCPKILEEYYHKK